MTQRRRYKGIKISIDEKYGCWTVIDDIPIIRNKERSFLCECICGNRRYVDISQLTKEPKKCKQCVHTKNANVGKHGMKNSRIYTIWCGMKARCSQSKNQNYHGKGITVCNEWSNDFTIFYKWSIENGYNDNLTIDRIDANKGYEPSNCRWISHQQNAFNKGPHKDNKSKYKGVHYWDAIGKYRAAITKDYKKYDLGLFDTAEEAARAYNQAAIELHGEYAYLNPVIKDKDNENPIL